MPEELSPYRSPCELRLTFLFNIHLFFDILLSPFESSEPGGTIQLTEVNSIACQPQTSFRATLDPVLVKLNAILGSVEKAFHKDFAVGGHLKSNLLAAGLKNVRYMSSVYPVGKVAETMFGFEKKNNGAK